MAFPLALAAGAAGGLSKLFGDRGAARNAENEAENQRRVAQFGVDTSQSGLTRRGSIIGALLRRMQEKPDTYGGIGSNFFGFLPGPLTEQMMTLPAAPKMNVLRPNSLMSFLGGAASGVGSYLGNRGAAESDALGRILSAGQPTRGGASIGGASGNLFGVGSGLGPGFSSPFTGGGGGDLLTRPRALFG